MHFPQQPVFNQSNFEYFIHVSHFLNYPNVPQPSRMEVEDMCWIDAEQQYLYSVWFYCLFYLSAFIVGLFGYRMYQFLLRRNSQMMIYDEMKTLIEEIQSLSPDEKKDNANKYYILTNVLVNRFRIYVYKKILNSN